MLSFYDKKAQNKIIILTVLKGAVYYLQLLSMFIVVCQISQTDLARPKLCTH